MPSAALAMMAVLFVSDSPRKIFGESRRSVSGMGQHQHRTRNENSRATCPTSQQHHRRGRPRIEIDWRDCWPLYHHAVRERSAEIYLDGSTLNDSMLRWSFLWGDANPKIVSQHLLQSLCPKFCSVVRMPREKSSLSTQVSLAIPSLISNSKRMNYLLRNNESNKLFRVVASQNRR